MFSYKITFQGRVAVVIADSKRDALIKAGLVNPQTLDLLVTRRPAGLLKNYWH